MSESSSKAFRVDSVAIRQFDGVTRDKSFSLEDLSSQVNIIFGPNGCGKSTTARTLQHLIWPQKSENFRDASAMVKWEDEEWSLDAVGKEVERSKNGQPVSDPQWAAVETRNRYHWSLQNLLRDQDQTLADQIAKEMAGGIDFQELASTLDWQKKPSAPQKLHQTYLAAKKKLQQAKELQKALQIEARKIDGLRQECERARQTSAKVSIWEMAKEVSQKSGELQQAEAILAEAPPGMSDLRGDDAELFKRIQDELRETFEKRTGLQEQKAALGEGECSWATFGEDDFSATRKELAEYLRQWTEVQRELKETDRRLTETEAKEQKLRLDMRIQPQAALELEAGFSYPELREWVRLIYKEVDLHSRKESLEESLPSHIREPDILEVDLLREGRRDLERWLKATVPDKALVHASFILSMLMLSAVLIYLCKQFGISWGILLALLPPIILHVLLFKKTSNQWVEELQHRYPEQLPQPAEWDEASVREILARLDEQIRLFYDYQSVEKDQKRLRSIDKELLEISNQIETLHSQLEEKGLVLDFEPEWMIHFLATVHDWRKLRTETAAIEAVKDRLETDLTQLGSELKRLLQKWGQSEGDLSVETSCQLLSDRMEAELNRRRQMSVLDIHLKQVNQQIEEKQSDLESLCKRISLSQPDFVTLKHRISLLEDWRKTASRADNLRSRLSELRKALGDDFRRSEESMETIDAELQACSAARETENALRDQLSKLEQRMEDQQRGRGVHEAEEALEACREELKAERKNQLNTRMGMEVLDWLQEQCRSRDRSRVLEEANRNLVLFSRNTLQLHLSSEQGTGGFSASRPGHHALPLSQLSSGERTQVLMAVRLAFLRLHEHAPLPLLVDEALGTSDDERGEQIIKALIDVSKQGRQIFYFTAQQDEVDKWRQVVEAENTEAKFIDLEKCRGMASRAERPARTRSPVEKPDPARQPEEDLYAWSERLNIPAWNPHQPIEDLSLWHLLHEKENAYVALYNLNIKTLGQWLIFENAGALRNIETQELGAEIEALRILKRKWEVGRPPRVPEALLQECDAVTDKFLRPVVALCKKEHGQAHRILHALKNGEVSGFRQQKIAELEQVLLQKGYLTDVEPLDRHEIMATAMAELPETTLHPKDWHMLMNLFFKPDLIPGLPEEF